MSNNEVIDIIENLKQENQNVFNQLIFANHCLKYSIEFITFVDSVFNKINEYLEENDISKYKEFVSRYESMLKGINKVTTFYFIYLLIK